MSPAVVSKRGGTNHSLVQASLVPTLLVTPLRLYWSTLTLIGTQKKTLEDLCAQTTNSAI